VASRSASPPSRQSAFPVSVILETLDAWQRDPTVARLGSVLDALRVLLQATGARGAYLDVEAEPIPRLRVGVGTLKRRPTSGRQATLQQESVRIDGGRVEAGILWLDTSAENRAPERLEAVRALEIALDAAWSRATVRRTVDRLEALDAATRGIAGVLSLERVLQLICDRLRELVGAEYAALGMADSDGILESFVTSGIGRTERERIGPLPEGHGLLGLIIREGASLRLPDIGTDPRSHGFPPNHPSMVSFLGVPIMVKGRAVGDLYMTNKRAAREFSLADQELVEMFALHAGIAIENARLHEQVQRMAVVEERERIGKDLHDGIIQGIYGVGLSLEDVPDLMDENPGEAKARIERAIERLNLTIRDIRNFIFGLRPELLEQVGLVGGLAALADEFRLNTMVDVELFADGDRGLDLPPEPTLQLLHIAREGLSNTARHANASRASLVVRSEGSAVVVLEVSDNGRGFTVERQRGPSHQGLPNMRARAAALGGSFQILSGPGAGTRIIVRVPYPREP
jgi:signal transduction histidine kinase